MAIQSDLWGADLTNQTFQLFYDATRTAAEWQLALTKFWMHSLVGVSDTEPGPQTLQRPVASAQACAGSATDEYLRLFDFAFPGRDTPNPMERRRADPHAETRELPEERRGHSSGHGRLPGHGRQSSARADR